MEKLTDFLAANPAAKAEYDSAIATAKANGVSEGKETAAVVMKAAAPILASAEYPQSVKDRVVAKAEKFDAEAILDLVAVFDAAKAGATVAGAIEGQGAETPPQAPEGQASADEQFKSKKDRVGGL